MASYGFRTVRTCWVTLFAALLLLGLAQLMYRDCRITHAIQGPTDKAASDAGQQQVLLTLSQLEEIRRQVATGMQTTHVFVLYHLEQIAKKKSGKEAAQVKAVLAEAADRLRVTQLDLSSLDRLAGLSAWRDREAAALSQVVQQRLHTLQNPVDCHTAKKLICQADRVLSGVQLGSSGMAPVDTHRLL
ncbi:alpha-(1,6)-fucosyltransferase-like [Eriocheir sinensis]|uniref:alpha-(1,6)-fucosyltransferase-like n=1 Tax=Eriocheir sinensis TaxID=95602 RepID=UPI0021C5EA4B|nr:alpha-(1,6)-fucosyltransferase-like [Eriocheir sinensis]